MIYILYHSFTDTYLIFIYNIKNAISENPKTAYLSILAGNMAAQKVQLIHPAGKNAPAISRETFDLFEKAIIAVLQQHQPLTFTALADRVEDYLLLNKIEFTGSIPWYSVCVKLHLEATGIIMTKTERGTKMYYLKQS